MHYGIPAKIVNIINQSSCRVETVTYLGSIIDKQGGTDPKQDLAKQEHPSCN